MKIKHSNFQKFLEALTFALLLSSCIYIIISWKSIPDEIPTHYNASGKADNWGAKSEIIILPIINLFLYLLLTVVTFLPQAWNIPVKVTDENREFIYSSLKTLLILLKLFITIAFSYINYSAINYSNLSVWFLPVFILSIFGTIIYSIIRISLKRN